LKNTCGIFGYSEEYSSPILLTLLGCGRVVKKCGIKEKERWYEWHKSNIKRRGLAMGLANKRNGNEQGRKQVSR
jgi:hypothetical protein